MSIILVKKGMLKLKNSKRKKILITVPAPLILCRKQSVKIHETTYVLKDVEEETPDL